ncbi:MAG TPA: ATP-binding protein [Candidatus Eubacterium avistercoris]|uniref:ATP-binding protein n=1 Tax=Candidatus Eubacterium avistercoris TaxID=2838567 RepID=A0A9D2D536_9FIRM|nr:ATP-binding protein [Candidatus Eubacterium avistercoris]
MQITDLRIRNFKSIKDMHVENIENALILVGKNNTGKTAVLDAIRLVSGDYQVKEEDFLENYPNIEVYVSLKIGPEDLRRLHSFGMISQYRRYESWEEDFCRKLPGYQEGILKFVCIINRERKVRFEDGYHKNNEYIPLLFPKLYFVDSSRDLNRFQDDLLMMQEDKLLKQMRNGSCMFEQAKMCNHCFSCIGLICQKKPAELNAFETARLLDYKLYQLNLDDFSMKVNQRFRSNGGTETIVYSMNRDIEKMLSVTAEIYNEKRDRYCSVNCMGRGMRSIYMLSLLETYETEEAKGRDIIMIEEPEIFLHPKLQKISGDILYRLSKYSQVIFSTHSANLLINFNSRQIRQIAIGETGFSEVCAHTDISNILDDLGYSANDLMNVNFVFIVEGKQDKSRLPLLLKKYYSEIYDQDGKLYRIAVITTNSCTNIKTYANLKYMNQIYLKDNFLMIRDGDGKDARELKQQLCRYYEERNLEDIDRLPRVREKNVLILKYYSFENYFLNPDVMARLGIVDSREQFYEILLDRWKEYLHKLRSGRKLQEVIGKNLETVEDIKTYMEEIKIYVRGHNLYDIFYGRYREHEKELLEQYIELAPREDFKDILDPIESFIYFESRRKEAD